MLLCLAFSSETGLASERDYTPDKSENIVWRAMPEILLKTPSHSEQKIDLSQEHQRLKEQTEGSRKLLGYAGGGGNCACASLSVVFEDGTKETVELVPIINDLADTSGMDLKALRCFTTMKARRKNTTVYSNSVPITRGSSNTLDEVRKLIGHGERSDYVDAELQIVDSLYFKSEGDQFRYVPKSQFHPLLTSVLTKPQHQSKAVALIVLNIYTELDPCGWCGQLLQNFLAEINKQKVCGNLCQQVFNEKLQLKQNLNPKASPALGTPRGCSDIDKTTREELDQLQKQVQKLINKSMNARFMIVVSSSLPCHRSREIGLDPVFMDAELSKLPMVVSLSEGKLSLQEHVTEIPENIVVYTPASDVKDFPLTRRSTPTGYSMRSLLNGRVSAQEYSDKLSNLPKGGVPPVCGLTNIGNTCYFNATMQALNACPALKAQLKKRTEPISKNLSNIFEAISSGTATTDIQPHILMLAQQLQEAGHNSHATQNLHDTAAGNGGGQQQDAKEMLTDIINCVLEEEQMEKIGQLRSSGKSVLQGAIDKTTARNLCEEAFKAQAQGMNQFITLRTNVELPDNTSFQQVIEAIPITKSLTGVYTTTITGTTTCKHRSVTNAPFTMLILDIKGSTGSKIGKLSDYVQHFTEATQLTGDDQWQCELCNNKVNATKQMSLSNNLPQTLIIMLKRFVADRVGSNQKKLTHKVAYDEHQQINGTNYNLKAVIYHYGTTLAGGHYTASVRHGTQWYYANDESVTALEPNAPQPDKDEQQAYLLFYEKNDAAATSSSSSSSASSSSSSSRSTNPP
ncbi:MAG: ubiquitin carboxyl-terminal hydrolase [Holosporales bacterium]|jgi:ubiquitin C-terminal hydrolase|nr:ubiquitin carboxyl-terminal hydrolase [Holosporales bacterium]